MGMRSDMKAKTTLLGLLSVLLLPGFPAHAKDEPMPNDCAIFYSKREDLGSYGGFNFDTTRLLNIKVKENGDWRKYLYKRGIEPEGSITYNYSYWIVKDFCNRLESDLEEPPRAGSEPILADFGTAAYEIVNCDRSLNCVSYLPLGTDSAYVYLARSTDSKRLRAPKWYARIFTEVEADVEEQRTFDLINDNKKRLRELARIKKKRKSGRLRPASHPAPF